MKARLILIALSALAAGHVQASTITYSTGGAPASIPGVAAFETFGDEMDGMSVTATFASGLMETRSWADTGPGSGGVSGTGWDLSASGDTFSPNAWSFNFTNANLTLTSLLLNGVPGLTLFDRTEPGPGTPGSALGRDYTDSLPVDILADVTYLDVIGVGANAPVGDLYHRLQIDYSGVPGTSFTFSQDTDNDIRVTIPVPGTVPLLGIALAGLGVLRRRRL